MTNRILRYSGLGLAVLAAGAIVACSSSDSPTTPGTAGTPGTGGAHTGGGSGGALATGGSTTTGGANTAGINGTAGSATAGTGGASAGYPCSNTALTSDVITDFSNLVPNATSTGNYTFTGGVLGGTFSYQAGALTLDTLTNTALKVTGNVKDYDGFGLYFNTCYNAGAYTGVSFSIKGYAGPKGKVNFRVQTNSTTAVMMSSMKGTCVPTSAANPYPDCHASSFDVPVTATANVVTVMFSQLKDGVPVPLVDGKDVVGLEWAFDWTPPPAGGAGAGAGGAASGGASSGGSGGRAGAGSGGRAGAGSGGSGGAAPAAGPYDADVTIDDVKFIGGPVFGGTGGSGAGGASTGGASASAGAGGAKAGSGGTGG